MNTNLKQLLDQLEYIKKSQNSLIYDSLNNSKSAVDSMRTINAYLPNITNTATLMRENIENSKSAVDNMRAINAYLPNITNTATLMRESIENSKSAVDNMRAIEAHTPYIVNNALLIRNSLEDIERIAQEFSILKYANIIDFISNLNLDLISLNYENRFSGKYSKQFDLFIRNNGWLIPNCASEEFIDLLYSSFDNNEEIDKKFVDYFSDNNFEVILELKEKWNSENLIPKGNLKIISNAINLILNDNGQNYADIIIPSLLAQIDILISQVLIKNGYTEKNRKFYNKSYNAKDLGNIRTFRENFAENIIDNWEEHHVNFLLENLFANNDSKSNNSLILNFNRHNIMHGLDDKYGTFENLIRCLLVIDFLNDFLSDDLQFRLN